MRFAASFCVNNFIFCDNKNASFSRIARESHEFDRTITLVNLDDWRELNFWHMAHLRISKQKNGPYPPFPPKTFRRQTQYRGACFFSDAETRSIG